MRKLLKKILFSFMAIILVLIVSFIIFYKRFVVEAPKIEYALPSNVYEAQLQDLNYLTKYIEKDRSFDSELKITSFLNLIDSLKAQIPLEDNKFIMSVAKVMAQADNTHTNINPSRISKLVNSIALRFYWFGNDLHVVLAHEKYKDLLGVKVKEINGLTPGLLLNYLKPYYGGSQNYLKFFSPLYFMSPELLDAIGYGYSKNSVKLTYENNIGIEEKIVIQASNDNNKDFGYWPPNWLNTSLIKSKNNWHVINPDVIPAIPFRNTNSIVNHAFIEKGLYVQINESISSDDIDTDNYLDNVFNNTKTKSIEFAVLDLRFNPGGDYGIGRNFIKNIVEELKGKPFYIITGNGTFSAGIMTAAIAKEAANGSAVVVGESVGDRLQFWADGGSLMELPNSKIPLRIWTAYHDWQNGCYDWSKCFWITIFDGVRVENLNPNLNVPLQFSDYINGFDSALNKILERENIF